MKDVLIGPLRCMSDASSDGSEQMVVESRWEFDEEHVRGSVECMADGVKDVLIRPLGGMNDSSSDGRE